MRLNSVRYSSFYIGEDLMSRLNCIYFEIDKRWIEIVVSEGVITTKIVKEPILKNVNEIKDKFKYPVYEMRNSDYEYLFDSVPIFSSRKIMLNDNHNVAVGLKIFFDDGSFITIYDDHELESMTLSLNSNLVREDVSEKEVELSLFDRNTQIGEW